MRRPSGWTLALWLMGVEWTDAAVVGQLMGVHPARRDRGAGPSRRHDPSRLGLGAMIAGPLAAFMTANVAGMPV